MACPAGSSRHPASATRRSAGFFEPPIQIGGRGCCTGRGVMPTDVSPLGTNSLAHASFTPSMAASRSFPRSAKLIPERVELLLDVPGTHAEDHPTAREHVERRELLGRLQRVAVRADEHVRQQPDLRRLPREEAERRRPGRTRSSTSRARARSGSRRGRTPPRRRTPPGLLSAPPGRARGRRPRGRSPTAPRSACSAPARGAASRRRACRRGRCGRRRRSCSRPAQPGHTMLCSSEYAWSPNEPPSRPTPLYFVPPNGVSWLRCIVLMPTLPDRSRRAVRIARLESALNT